MIRLRPASLLLVGWLALASGPVCAQPAGSGGEVELAVAETLAMARSRLSPADYARFTDAVNYAREAHRGQSRDGGRPFFLHPLRVASSIFASPRHVSAAAVTAAILHDVVEDTPRTVRDVRARFGPKIANLVDYLSLPEVGGRYPDKGARDRAYYAKFKAGPREAHVVKFHDRLSNIRDMAGWGPAGKLGYLESTRATVIESLSARSPDLARALEAEVERLTARYEAELAANASALGRYRRVDGTLRWKPLLRDGVLREGAGLARFTLALFLKELAVVVRTGDRLRIEEFFDGLASTDFFVHYGLFSLGARAGEVAYARYLERLVKPGFVGGLLKTNVILATGLALPQLVQGTFEGEPFAISLASLGLSSTAVRAGLSGLRWASAGRAEGSLARLGLRVGKLGNAAGWVYTVAETAVVLYLADGIEERVHAWKDEREARGALADAGLAFFKTLGEEGLTVGQLNAALDGYRAAWDDWRAFLHRPLRIEEARLAERLERIAREAKLGADERAALLERVSEHPALRRSLEERHGSLEGFADERSAAGDAELEAKVGEALGAYERASERLLKELYRDLRRAEPYLAGAPLEAATSPAAGPFGRLGAGRERARLREALGEARETRPGSYADEARALELARELLRGRELLEALDRASETREREAGLDRRLGGMSGALAR